MTTLRITPLAAIIVIALQATSAVAAPENVSKGANAATAIPGTETDDNTRAQAMYRQALAVFKTDNYEEARRLLLQIWSFRRTDDVASALGKTELKLKLYLDAANHLQYCLDNFAPVSSPKTLQSIKQMLAEAREHVGTVRIKTNRDGVDVRLDGEHVGASPLKSPVYVQPGQHEVTLTQGSDKAVEPIEVAIGKTLDVDVPLEHAAPPPVALIPPAVAVVPPMAARASIPPPTPVVPPEEARRSVVPVIIGGAVFAVGVGAGIGFRLASNSKYDDAKAQSAKNGRYGCYSVSSGECTAQHNATTKVDQYRNLSTAGLITAAVAMIAVPVYWFWPRSAANSHSVALKSLKLHSGVSLEGSGIWFRGEF